MMAMHCSAEQGAARSEKTLAVYGVNLGKPPLEGKTSEEAAGFLGDLGVNAVFGGYDSAEFVAACRSRGITVYASLGIFVGENYWNSHPESHPVDALGNPIEKVQWYAGVCPNQPWLRAEKLTAIAKKAEEGLADGVWLDFIRYPVHWEDGAPRPKQDETCFCPVCLAKFQKDTGLTFPEQIHSASETAEYLLTTRREEWFDWRAEQIAEFVKEASATLHRANPKAKLGLFCVPWQPQDYDNAMRRVVGQDLKRLAPHVDVFSPMVYHKLCKRSPEWVGEVARYVSEQTGKTVWPITQAFNEPTEMSDEEFAQSVRSGLQEPSAGVILFSFGHMEKEGRFPKVREAFRSVR